MKSRQSLPLALLVGTVVCLNPLSAQDTKPLHRFFVGGGIGLCRVSSSQLSGDIAGTGLSIGAFSGFRFSKSLSLLLEYDIHHPKDETPKTSDLVVEKTSSNGVEIRRFVFSRYPKVLRTDLLLLSLQAGSSAAFYFRLSAGLGRQYSPDYTIIEDVVTSAGTSSRASFAYGIAGGYEYRLSSRLAISLEARALWSAGGTGTALRSVIGAGAVFKWDVF